MNDNKVKVFVMLAPESCNTCPMNQEYITEEYDPGPGCDCCVGGTYTETHNACVLLGQDPYLYDEEGNDVLIDISCPLTDPEDIFSEYLKKLQIDSKLPGE